MNALESKAWDKRFKVSVVLTQRLIDEVNALIDALDDDDVDESEMVAQLISEVVTGFAEMVRINGTANGHPRSLAS